MPPVETVAWTAVALGALLAVVLVWQTLRVARLERRYRAFMKGASPGSAAMSLGELIADQGARIEANRADIIGLRASVTVLEEVMARTVQCVGLVRYNPFQDTGGDQSFSLALLDRKGNGVVVSSLHSRTSTRFYAKSVKSGQSASSLSEEEVQALQQAMETVK